MQLFGTDKERDEFFKRVWLYAKNKNLIQDLSTMSNEIIGSKALGYLLYDEGVFEILQNTDRDFFAEHYVAIFSAMEKAGIYDSYTLLIEQVVGDGVSISYQSPKPRHLVIYIYDVESYMDRLITPSNLWLTTPDNLGLLVPKPVSEFSIAQLRKILEILANPSGTYLDIRFTEPPLPDFITILDAPEALERGDSYLIVAQLAYTDNSTVNSQQNPELFTFESSNPLLATVDSDGNVSVLPDAEFGAVMIAVTSVEDPLVTSFVNIAIYQKVTYLTFTPGDPYNKGITDQVGYELDSYGAVAPDDWLSVDGAGVTIAYIKGYGETDDDSQVFFIKSEYAVLPDYSSYLRWLNAEKLNFTASNDVESHSAVLQWEGDDYVNRDAPELNAFLRANKDTPLSVEIEILEIAKNRNDHIIEEI